MSGQNKPCPCGSGKKYKRCCGMDPVKEAEKQARKLEEQMGGGMMPPGMPGGIPGMPAMGGPLSGPAGGPGLGMPGGPMGSSPGGGMDPSKMDPKLMKQMAKALKKLPKEDLKKLKSLTKRAMSGEDVTAELKDIQAKLPEALAAVEDDSKANAADTTSEKTPGKLGRLWKGITGKK